MSSSILTHPNRYTHWDIQEGTAEEVAASLEHSNAPALVFISHADEDHQRARAVFDTLKRASLVADALIERRQTHSWEALIEALTPDIPLSNNRIIEAEMYAEAIKRIVESSDFVRAADLARLGDFSKSNLSSQPNRWKRAGQTFAVNYKRTDLFPLYSFDLTSGIKPLEIMQQILRALHEKPDWQKAFWFSSANSYLKNKKPKDLLTTAPQEVLKAAEIEAAGVQHG